MRTAAHFLVAVAVFTLAACQREEREFRPDPVATETEEEISQSPLVPGGPRLEPSSTKGDQYVENAYLLAEGKRLYSWYNCAGCHFNGGGGIGPPLMDDKWIYGDKIENIVATIREGRPNGMPSFRGKVPDDQIWELAAYVRSMSGNVPMDAAPARNDDMHPGPAENRRPTSPPVSGGTSPPGTQMPQ